MAVPAGDGLGPGNPPQATRSNPSVASGMTRRKRWWRWRLVECSIMCSGPSTGCSGPGWLGSRVGTTCRLDPDVCRISRRRHGGRDGRHRRSRPTDTQSFGRDQNPPALPHLGNQWSDRMGAHVLSRHGATTEDCGRAAPRRTQAHAPRMDECRDRALDDDPGDRRNGRYGSDPRDPLTPGAASSRSRCPHHVQREQAQGRAHSMMYRLEQSARPSPVR